MRLRFRYTKWGKIRFLGHRDLARCWERALRRARVPFASTEGFSPRPKLHFGLALPLGFESAAEYLDVDLEVDHAAAPGAPGPGEPGALVALAGAVSAGLPDGVDVTAVAPVDAKGSLQSLVVACDWELVLDGVTPAVATAVLEGILGEESVVVERIRKGRTTRHDLRPGIATLRVAGEVAHPGGGPATLVEAQLSAQDPSVKPAELLTLVAVGLGLPGGCVPGPLGGALADPRVTRTTQWIDRDGARWEPLPLATHGTHLHGCAS